MVGDSSLRSVLQDFTPIWTVWKPNHRDVFGNHTDVSREVIRRPPYARCDTRIYSADLLSIGETGPQIHVILLVIIARIGSGKSRASVDSGRLSYQIPDFHSVLATKNRNEIRALTVAGKFVPNWLATGDASC
jgi:hypothetical protein